MAKIADHSMFPVLLRLVRNHVKPYLKRIIIAIVFMTISAACNAVIVKLVQPAIDDIFLTQNQEMLILIPIVVFAISALKGGAEYCHNYLIKFVGQRILTDLQILMYEHLLKADISYIQKQSSGKIISRFTNDIAMMRGAVSNLLVGIAKHLLSIIFLIAVMFKLEPGLSFITFFVFPLAIYPIQRIGQKMRKISYNTQEELGNYTAKLDETFSSIKVVKSYLAEKVEISRAKVMTDKIFHLYRNSAKLDSLTSPIMEILSGLAIAAIIWYGGMLIIEGKSTPGSLFAFITAFVSAYRPYKSLVSLNTNLQEGIAAAKRVFKVLDYKPSITDQPNAKNINLSSAHIIFDHVTLKYGAKTAINKISLSIPSNKMVAIVGRSGSGKTSLANLLLRFYEIDEGKLLINDHSINEITLASLRSQIAYVTQDVMLFDSTISDNMSYGSGTISQDKIIEAAKKADAHEFIMQLPQGYDTQIGYQGLSLSGGQRQRISIARAFLKNAPILIMDEASSALDSSSDANIQGSIRSLKQNRTTIIITHKLASITDCDMIIVMKNGKIEETGTHDELLDSHGEYRKLYSNNVLN